MWRYVVLVTVMAGLPAFAAAGCTSTGTTWTGAGYPYYSTPHVVYYDYGYPWGPYYGYDPFYYGVEPWPYVWLGGGYYHHEGHEHHEGFEHHGEMAHHGGFEHHGGGAHRR
jgi:hypothetical protein